MPVPCGGTDNRIKLASGPCCGGQPCCSAFQPFGDDPVCNPFGCLTANCDSSFSNPAPHENQHYLVLTCTPCMGGEPAVVTIDPVTCSPDQGGCADNSCISAACASLLGTGDVSYAISNPQPCSFACCVFGTCFNADKPTCDTLEGVWHSGIYCDSGDTSPCGDSVFNDPFFQNN